MSAFMHDGSTQKTGTHGTAHSERRSAARGKAQDGVHGQTPDLRLAVLARAIEHEIIPRLMLAHRATHACLTPAEGSGEHVTAEDVAVFSKLVLAPGEDLAHSCISSLRARGVTVESIFLDLLAPVARHLGDLWDQDLCDFTEVTMGLGRLQQVLRELSPSFGHPLDATPNGRRVLLMPGLGEQHTFGLVMVAEFFRRAGWDVAGGPWASDSDAAQLVKRDWFDVVGFSLGNEGRIADLAETIRDVRKASMNPRIGIIVGGPLFAVHPEYARQVHADAVATDGRQAPILAEELASGQTKRG